MSTFDRTLAADVNMFRLGEEREHANDASILERTGRNARTLVKDGVLRVTLIVLAPGGDMPEHQAVGPITVHVLSGSMRFSADGLERDMKAGDLLTIGAAPGATHRAEG